MFYLQQKYKKKNKRSIDVRMRMKYHITLKLQKK